MKGYYWESSIKDHLYNDRISYTLKTILNNMNTQQEVFVMSENNNMNNRKYKVGDLVNIKGEKEVFEIIEWEYDCSHDKRSGFVENSVYNLRAKSGRSIEQVDEDDVEMTLVVVAKAEKKIDPNSKEGIDFLLDKHNECLQIQKLIDSTGVKDNEFKNKAKEIMSYLKRESKKQLNTTAKSTQ